MMDNPRRARELLAEAYAQIKDHDVYPTTDEIDEVNEAEEKILAAADCLDRYLKSGKVKR